MLRVAALYQFTRFADCSAIRARLSGLCVEAGIKGTILIAPEGINGTIAGAPDAVEHVIAHIRTLPGCNTLDVKNSFAESPPFRRMKVRLKREIVTMGQPDIDPLREAGHYVTPSDWNALIASPDTVVIDTRNDYEVAIGSFAGAINPQTATFGEFPAWVRAHCKALTGRKIAMFCTGGIRCEKATAFLKAEGFEDVHHLKGGILKYLEDVPAAESRWEGECFVFDQRVAIGHGLTPGSHDLCHACRTPITAEDKASAFFTAGVSCPKCHDTRDDQQRAGYAERQRQVERNPAHLGG